MHGAVPRRRIGVSENTEVEMSARFEKHVREVRVSRLEFMAVKGRDH